MAGSARGLNGQGRVLHPSVAAVQTGPNDRASFSSSPTRALAGLVARWTSLAENEIQGFSSESSCTGRFHELQISGKLGGQTWAKWALPLSPFAGLARQSGSLWGGDLVLREPSAAVAPALADAADVRLAACAAVVCVVGSADGLP